MERKEWKIAKSIITVIVYIAGVITGCLLAPHIFGW